MIKSINNKNINFKGATALKGGAKLAQTFIKSQENLSSTRFIQDTVTNWMPKAVFARSTADFAEMSFLEFLESAIFYFASPLLGEKLFRNKVFKRLAPKELSEQVNKNIPKKVGEIVNDKLIPDEIKKRTIAQKAGIVLACTAIPVAEYTLSFAKNLFTLKTFKKSNFNAIANLDKANGEKEDLEHQQKVEKSAKKNLVRGAIISIVGVIAGLALGTFGHKSDKLQKLSKGILEPGKALTKGLEKVGVKSKKVKNTVSKFSLDFDSNNGKLALSKGQLALTAILGLFGYSAAAKDRGKLDVQEVWTRVPLVVFYTIFGGELFEKGFMKILGKKNKFPELIQKNAKGKITVPKLDELPKLAKNIAKTKNTNATEELAKLTKQKAFITAVPYAFSLLFMGVSLSALTRFWTQYRYNKQQKEQFHNAVKEQKLLSNLPDTFKAFQ